VTPVSQNGATPSMNGVSQSDYLNRLAGHLIVIEGPDGVGRSTLMRLLKEWLEDRGFGVVDTGLTRSRLAGPGIKQAKTGHTLDPITTSLFYATDFADRVERQIEPALEAGMIALSDRYVYSMITRASVRGVDREWLESIYRFVPPPDVVIYLDAEPEVLLQRVINKGGIDFWESGQDFLGFGDPYQSFIEYQSRLISEFRALAVEHKFRTVPAHGSVSDVFRAALSELQQSSIRAI